jgi:hypothetical protein
MLGFLKKKKKSIRSNLSFQLPHDFRFGFFNYLAYLVNVWFAHDLVKIG